MPLYEFKARDTGCPHCAEGFEILLKLTEDKPTVCPHCGNAVVQLISAPYVQAGSSHHLNESNIEKHGFTQYRKAGGGVYEKTAGKGPDFIADDGK